MNDRLKKIIFEKLSKNISEIDIIFVKETESVFFIDIKDEYWYFELEKSGFLWWRLDFFRIFFKMFSIEFTEYDELVKTFFEKFISLDIKTTQHSTMYKEANTVYFLPEIIKKINRLESNQRIKIKDLINKKNNHLFDLVPTNITNI
jgi:hypothetical protein